MKIHKEMRKYLVVLFIVYITSYQANSQQIDCPAGWVTSRNNPSWSCYLITNKIQRSWSDAQTFCTQMGGSLWKIDTLNERNWVYNLLTVYHGYYPSHTEWWLGLHDNPTGPGMFWTDKTSPDLRLLKWVPGESMSHDHSQSCVQYYNGSLKHNDCQIAKYFICERSRSTAVFCDARRGWESINKMCYKVITKLRSWDDSRAECQKENGDLMVVEDVETETNVKNFIESRNTDMWIGLRGYKLYPPEKYQNANKSYIQGQIIINTGGSWSFKWQSPTGKDLNQVNSFWASKFQNYADVLHTVTSTNGSSGCVLANHSLTGRNVWQPTECRTRAFSLCQKPQGRCASGWIANGYKCYQIVTWYKTSWSNAAAFCQQQGAQLITIQSNSTQQFVGGFLSNFKARGINAIWIGLSDNNQDVNRWYWSSGISLYSSSFNNYKNPVNRPGVNDCFNIFTDDTTGTWQIASSCSNNNSFICEISRGASPKLPPTLTPPTISAPGQTASTVPVTWSSDCGPFWVKDPTTQYCYKFSDSTMNWFQAEEMCKSMGAHLTSINNYHEERFIADQLYGFNSPALWIGINSLNTQSGYHWVDGTGFGYLNWAPGEPNNAGDYEHCGELIHGGPNRAKWNDARCDNRRGYVCRKISKGEPNNFGGNEKCGEIIPRGSSRNKWNDVNCNGKRGYICKKRSKAFHTAPPPRTPNIPAGKIYGCPNDVWKPYNGNCYMFMTTTTNWINAAKFCQNLNATLASILDENEQNFVASQLPVKTGYKIQDQYLIGLNDKDVDMRFEWTDGMAVTYTNWAHNEPNNWQNRPEDCVSIIQLDGTWNDVPCDEAKAGFVCKTHKAILPRRTPQSNPSQGCPAGAFGFGYNCFQIMTGKATWQGAKANCAARSGQLVEINNWYQQAFIASQIAGTSGFYWIGLSHNGQTGALQWATGGSVGYTAWSSNHTGNDNTSCVVMKAAGPGVGLWMDMPCTSTFKYICETPRSGFSTVLVQTTTAAAPPKCPPNWDEFNGYCYKAFKANEDKKNYFEARSTCVALGADLVSIHSNAEHSFVFSGNHIGYSGSFWIGLNDFDQEKGFKWSDGSAVNFTKWNTGEPNDSDGTDDCVEYNTWSRKWNDNTCYVSQGFICKIKKGIRLQTTKATPPPTDPPQCGSSSDWKLYNGSCYYVNTPKTGPNSRKTWYEARDYCIQQGGDLPSLHSIQENGFLSTLASRTVGSDCWIGLKDQGVNQFGWSDGTPLDFIHWSGGEPNDAFGSEKCAQLKSSTGYWNDNNCNLKYHFICKRPQGVFTPSPTLQTTPIHGGCPSGYTASKYGSKCFKIYAGRDMTARLNYTAATAACRALGAGYDIASIANHDEQATLIVMVNGVTIDNVGIWIGINDLNQHQQFTWQDNSRIQLTNWDKNEPQRSGGHCVEMMTDLRRAGRWHNIQCSAQRPYICQIRKDPSKAIVTALPTCTLQGYIDNSMDCYKLYTAPATWQDAVDTCTKDTTYLTSILTVYEQAFIDTLSAALNSPIWIGMADTSASGTYTWRDGNRVSYTSWGQNEPTFTQGGSGRCVMSYQGFWNDSDCSNSFPFICKNPLFIASNTPNPGGYCKDVTWKQFDNFCYYVNLSPTFTYSQAEADCTSRGMNVASISSKLEENFVLRTIDSDPKDSINIWIGLRKKGGFFTWADNAPPSYINWKTGPTGHDCVMMRHIDGYWQDSSCMSQKGYVCKTPKLPATSPPPTTTPPPTTRAPSTTATTVKTTKPSTSNPVVHVSSSVIPPQSSTSSKVPSTKPTGLTMASSNTRRLISPGGPVVIATPGNPQSLKQRSSGDLSGGQIAGIVVGVLVILIIACVVLMVVKQRGGLQFSFQRLKRGSSGFDNATYDIDSDEVRINDASGNNLRNGIKLNGNSVGFRDFEEDNN